ncbi:MAG: hypothetical protein WCS52_07205 [bacterium]
MSEDIKSGTGSIPPRLTIKQPGQGEGGAMSPPETPASAPLASPGLNQVPSPDMGAPLNPKKRTARIALDQVSAEPGAAATVSAGGLASKTIRLAPAMSGQVSAVPLASVGKAMTGIFVAEDTKRKTSRISLDSVLPQLDAAASGADAPPKTIKIKRPTISQAPALSPLQSNEPVVTSATEPSSKSQTARVDIPPEAMAAEGQQTQKKTIKIRRAEGGGAEVKGAPRSISISRTEAEVSAPVVSQVAVPHWSFVLVASAAVVTMCVMLYVLMAQAYPSLGWSVGG